MRVAVRPRLWTRRAYHRAAERGVLALGARVELLDGAIVRREANTPAHFSGVVAGAEALKAVLASGFYLRQQAPTIASDLSEPEPDIAVVVGGPRDYVRRHPRADQVRLVVEISDATLSLDRNRKAELYARAGVPDYWVEDVRARTVETFRDPEPNPDRSGRFRYRTRAVFRVGDIIAPLPAASFAPGAVIAVSDFLAPDTGV